MRYKNQSWKIAKLLDLIKEREINLSPEYQRNDIWSIKAQEKLLASIKKGWPLPNFFILEKSDNDYKYEMVDGQQRSRAIWAHEQGELKNKSNLDHSAFLDYEINVTLLSDLNEDEKIEDFYTLVNSAGVKLNRPELNKATYYDSLFFKLAQELSQNETLVALDLFNSKTIDRMNDVEFILELLTTLEFGITDKKTKLDELLERDITEEQKANFIIKFESNLDKFKNMNQIKKLSTTRYKQKADFYSLFVFFNDVGDEDLYTYIYKSLVILDPFIYPTQEECEPLREYAINCVSQSNGQIARDKRDKILRELFLNTQSQPNKTQEAILNFFDIENDLENVADIYFPIKLDALQNQASLMD
jgi:hypothetical protein